MCRRSWTAGFSKGVLQWVSKGTRVRRRVLRRRFSEDRDFAKGVAGTVSLPMFSVFFRFLPFLSAFFRFFRFHFCPFWMFFSGSDFFCFHPLFSVSLSEKNGETPFAARPLLRNPEKRASIRCSESGGIKHAPIVVTILCRLRPPSLELALLLCWVRAGSGPFLGEQFIST